eukprot:CAMPEP_0196571398 /NCGR_PEP_ID=MMETSP1081-20130531/1587_1 /TAXON_ID=36882 /ORGANISM="Pyramimonas amylifera, Strain CCMP720" /LENGTH=354 /DNA_ID=CAMNT_0041888335 /DNA_START=94 /DNA_END=1158 /DNA_ORIENTATION=+
MSFCAIQNHSLVSSLSQKKPIHTRLSAFPDQNRPLVCLKAKKSITTCVNVERFIKHEIISSEKVNHSEAVNSSRRSILAGLGLVWFSTGDNFVLPALADETSKVFVAGATGQTGRRVVQELQKRGVAVRAGVRDLKKAQSLGLATGGGVELIQFDVTSDIESIKAAIGDADAVICATGFSPTAGNWGGLKPGSSVAVDKKGTENLVEASKSLGSVKHFVLVSSLLTNGKACKQTDNPNFKVLEAFGGILTSKRQAEVALQNSGLDYTIVRPGGLSNEPASGGIVVKGADRLLASESDPGREVSRDSVAEVTVEALFASKANKKIVEMVGVKTGGTPKESWFDVPVAPSFGCATD